MNLTKSEEKLLIQCGLLPGPEVALSWQLIAYKLMYYRPDLVHKSWHRELTISDFEYDKLENDYINESEHPYTTSMVGVDMTRPSVKLVIKKYSKPV